jgi:hypothetical protein
VERCDAWLIESADRNAGPMNFTATLSRPIAGAHFMLPSAYWRRLLKHSSPHRISLLVPVRPRPARDSHLARCRPRPSTIVTGSRASILRECRWRAGSGQMSFFFNITFARPTKCERACACLRVNVYNGGVSRSRRAIARRQPTLCGGIKNSALNGGNGLRAAPRRAHGQCRPLFARHSSPATLHRFTLFRDATSE